MVDESKEITSNETNIEVSNEEINLQFHWYLFSFLMMYFGSLVLPGIIFMGYILLFFMPNFLEATSLFNIFTNLNSFLTLIFMPIILISCYIIHLIVLAFITRILWGITEKKSPSKDGVIPRNVPSKILNYYHIRSFIIKYPKVAFTKGIFPWLTNWMYNFIGSNEIGKGTTIEEQVCADKFIQIGKNSYIGVNSVLTSHLVEGIFGRTIYFKLKIGDNVTLGGWNCFASGTKIDDNSFLFPSASGGKHYIVKGNNYYFGMPLRKVFKKRLLNYLNLTEEEAEKRKIFIKKEQGVKEDINVSEKIAKKNLGESRVE